MTEIVDGIYVRTPGYGTPFATAITCMRCGCLVDGTQYTPAPTPRQVHAEWHGTLDELVADLRQRELIETEARR
jgi:hypothetical protein